MITGPLAKNVDTLWDAFWTGGISNPLSVVEQVSYLLFARLLDLRDARAERVQRNGGPAEPRVYGPHEQALRWSQIRTLGPAERKLDAFRKTFEHLKRELAKLPVGKAMAEAQLLIQKPGLFAQAMEVIDGLPLERDDLKGDIFEHVLSKLQHAGQNGQFRTPRHVVEFMCDLTRPQARERIGDPACGTAGFLVGALQWIRRDKTSAEGMIRWKDSDGSEHPYWSADELTREEREHLKKDTLYGFDFDATMLRLSSMNLYLHGIDPPRIHYQDTLANSFEANYGRESDRFFDLVLANPPFSGSLDTSSVHPDLLHITPTRKTELLFVALVLRLLKVGGRAAVIVPDGVLSGSTNGHKSLRKTLVEKHQLEAMISLPVGVFRPYTGVATGILIFRRGGETREVFFYDVARDGFSLDDKRTEQPGTSELPDAAQRFHERDAARDTDRTAKWFMVPKAEIAEKGYDLSLNRYKETRYEEVQHEHPRVVLAQLKAIEDEILQGIKELERLL